MDQMAEPLMEILGALGIMGALWYGGYRVIAGALTPGEFFSFTAAVILLYGPVRQISRMVNTVQQSIGSVERVFEILDTPPAIVDAPGALTLPGFGESIVFETVGFCYPEAEEWALRDISLTVRKGELVAFVGHVGRGQDHPDGSAAALPRRDRRAASPWTGTTCDRSRWPRCAR